MSPRYTVDENRHYAFARHQFFHPGAEILSHFLASPTNASKQLRISPQASRVIQDSHQKGYIPQARSTRRCCPTTTASAAPCVPPPSPSCDHAQGTEGRPASCQACGFRDVGYAALCANCATVNRLHWCPDCRCVPVRNCSDQLEQGHISRVSSSEWPDVCSSVSQPATIDGPVERQPRPPGVQVSRSFHPVLRYNAHRHH